VHAAPQPISQLSAWCTQLQRPRCNETPSSSRPPAAHSPPPPCSAVSPPLPRGCPLPHLCPPNTTMDGVHPAVAFGAAVNNKQPPSQHCTGCRASTLDTAPAEATCKLHLCNCPAYPPSECGGGGKCIPSLQLLAPPRHLMGAADWTQNLATTDSAPFAQQVDYAGMPGTDPACVRHHSPSCATL
jgi:hypothetical protein